MVVKRMHRHSGNRPNLHSVASRAGVSAMTVSRALSKPNKVAPETLAKIHRALDELNYLPNLAAETLRYDRSRVIIAVVPTLSYSIFSDTVQGISDVLDPAGYQLLLGNSGYELAKEERIVRTLLGHQPEGVILTGTLHTDAVKKYLASGPAPVVEMWDTGSPRIDMAVGFDNYEVGYELGLHLIKAGYRRLGYISTTDEHENRENRASLRSQGLSMAIADGGLPPPPRATVPAPLDMLPCGMIAADFVEEHRDVEAIVCANEIIGVGAMIELRKRGRDVPGDVGIAGIGDANFAGLVEPGLTTVHFRGYEIGKRAAQLIVSRIEGVAPTTDCVDVGFTVIDRGSTRTMDTGASRT